MSEPTVQTASEPVILTEKKGYIGYIILNRPKKLNAINWQVYREMIPAIEKMETDDDVKVVVLKGAGRCLSAGFDLSEPSFDDHEENRRMYERVAHRARWKLWSLPKPTIAQIHKFCLGGAHETMMACDMAICSDDTTFGIPEIKFGQGSCFPILPYSMTLRKARELILTGENYDAKTALEYGVVNYSVPMEELDAKVMELAKKLALVPTPALKLQKRCINRAVENMGFGYQVEQWLDILCLGILWKNEEVDNFYKKVAEVGMKEATVWHEQQLDAKLQADLEKA